MTIFYTIFQWQFNNSVKGKGVSKTTLFIVTVSFHQIWWGLDKE